MKQKQLKQNRQWVQGKFIIGIDSANEKHQAAIIDNEGILTGRTLPKKQDW